ncbi:MAG: hypothetical protein R3F43_15345 [bacterium]
MTTPWPPASPTACSTSIPPSTGWWPSWGATIWPASLPDQAVSVIRDHLEAWFAAEDPRL